MLNFSKFKKVAEDDKTVTMRHDKGHEMRILIKQLRPIEREQIKRLKMADGGDVESPDDAPTPIAPTSQSLQSPEPAPINVPQVPATPDVQNPDGTLNPGAAAQTATSAIDLGQKIDVQSAKAKANYDQQYLDERQRLNNLDAQHLQEMQSHTKDLSDFIQANPINPEMYGESQSGQQKVATGIGLFLGGMGGQGHSNLALDFLNKNIDRNIEGQRQNVNNQKTIWGAYHDLYGDENIANNLAKVSANDMLTHQVDLTAAQLGTPQAAQKAMQLRSQKAIENSKLLQDSAVNLKALPGYQETAAPGQSGSGSIEPSGKTQTSESNGMKTYPVLAPDAVQKSAGLRHVGYLDQGKLQTQLTQADQVDKVLNGPDRNGQGGIHQLLQNMYQDIGQGSLTGSLEQRVKGAAQHVPYIGDLGEKGLSAIYAGEGYKDFASKRTGMIQDLSTALQGMIAPTDITKLVDDNLPIHGDTPDDIDMKEQAIVNGIRKAMKTDELSKAGLLPKGQK